MGPGTGPGVGLGLGLGVGMGLGLGLGGTLSPFRASRPTLIMGKTLASSSWAVEGRSQIVVGCDRERSGKLTLWLRSGGAGDRNSQGIDGESPDEESSENGFGEHDYRECREEEQITTAPGLRFGR